LTCSSTCCCGKRRGCAPAGLGSKRRGGVLTCSSTRGRSKRGSGIPVCCSTCRSIKCRSCILTGASRCSERRCKRGGGVVASASRCSERRIKCRSCILASATTGAVVRVKRSCGGSGSLCRPTSGINSVPSSDQCAAVVNNNVVYSADCIAAFSNKNLAVVIQLFDCAVVVYVDGHLNHLTHDIPYIPVRIARRVRRCGARDLGNVV
jgi:hypothetical protein